MWCCERVWCRVGTEGATPLILLGRTVFGFRKTCLGEGGRVPVQFPPAWTSHISFASDLRVEKAMLALKDCGEDEDRVLD